MQQREEKHIDMKTMLKEINCEYAEFLKGNVHNASNALSASNASAAAAAAVPSPILD